MRTRLLLAFALVMAAAAVSAQVFNKQRTVPPREDITYYRIDGKGYVDIRFRIIESTNDAVTLQLSERALGLLVDVGEQWLTRVPIDSMGVPIHGNR